MVCPDMPVAVIKPGVEKSISRKHPWIFSGAIEKLKGSPVHGGNIQIQSNKGQKLGIGSFSPVSQIRIRVWTFNPDEDIDLLFFQKKIALALDTRKHFQDMDTDAYRLINSENDGLPGLIVDRYNDFLVCQFLSAGAEFWKNQIVSLLKTLSGITGIYERSDTESRQKEGLPSSTGVLWGQSPPETIIIKEHGLRFMVDIQNGHKTGFYLDQRDNRRLVAGYAAGKNVLNCFSYTGGFNVWALKGGASHVKNIDVSESALDLLRQNADLNHFKPESFETNCVDVFQALRTMRDSQDSFDLIILDPPKFAHTSHQINKAARGYKDINLLALKLLSPGGYLFTFSCSGHISPELFQKIIADAAVDAKRDVSVVRFLYQSEDHAIALNFPEGLYLKGLLCRAM